MSYQSVWVNTVNIQSEMHYNSELMLGFKISYPWFTKDKGQPALDRVNLFHQAGAWEYLKRCQRELYSMAVEQYRDSKIRGFPFHPYEALMTFEITYNRDCTVSTYFDRYEYTGGAHGSTIRSSDTFDTQSGRRRTLSSFFARPAGYRAYIIERVLRQIEDNIESGQNIYFENYRELVVKAFNPGSFYLRPEGVVIYFQQYDIAPYASGIIEFLIPFVDGVVLRPQCEQR